MCVYIAIVYICAPIDLYAGYHYTVSFARKRVGRDYRLAEFILLVLFLFFLLLFSLRNITLSAPRQYKTVDIGSQVHRITQKFNFCIASLKSLTLSVPRQYCGHRIIEVHCNTEECNSFFP